MHGQTNLAQALGYQPDVLTEPILFGRSKTIACEGRCCPDRTAPVFISIGTRGRLFLCSECRAWHSRIVRAALPELTRGGVR